MAERDESELNPGERKQYTGKDGLVTFEPVFAGRVSVQATREGYGAAWLIDQRVAPGVNPFELRLSPGRNLDIEVVDSDGQRSEASDVFLIGGPQPIPAEELDVGLYRLHDAPPGLVTLCAEFEHRQYTLSHDTSVPHARIVLPRLGQLTVRWTVPLQPGKPYTVLLSSQTEKPWSHYLWVEDDVRATGGPIDASNLLPGDYDVVLRQGRGWVGENQPVSQAVRVRVKAGEISEIKLEP